MCVHASVCPLVCGTLLVVWHSAEMMSQPHGRLWGRQWPGAHRLSLFCVAGGGVSRHALYVVWSEPRQVSVIVGWCRVIPVVFSALARMLVCVTWPTNPQRLIHPQDCALKTCRGRPRQRLSFPCYTLVLGEWLSLSCSFYSCRIVQGHPLFQYQERRL